MTVANIDPEAWELGSHVFGCFWDTANNNAVTRTEYIVIHRTKHFATVQLIGDRTCVYRKRLTLVDGNILPVRIGGFWLRPEAPTASLGSGDQGSASLGARGSSISRVPPGPTTPSEPAECASVYSSGAEEPASSSPAPAVSE